MKTKSILLILTILSVFISCIEGEWMRTEKSRHIIVTAHMPESGSTTRASLSQKEGSLDFLTQWDEGDAVNLRIEQDGRFYEVEYTDPNALPGEVSFNRIPIKNISEDRKSCTLDFDLPEGVDADRPYKVYGSTFHRGVVGSDDDDNEVLVFLCSFYRANSMSIPLYCEVESNALSSGIEFKHFLAYEILHIKNNSKETISFTHKGFDVDKAWYHLGCGIYIWPTYHYIETKYYTNKDSGERIEINAGETKDILSCYYPTGEKIENARLKAIINGNEVLSSDTKSSDLDIEPAKAYHMYAIWDGDELKFGKDEGMTIYPTSSYKLSEDGKTLERWYGQEKTIDMTADPAFDNVETIDFKAFEYGLAENIILSNKVTTIKKWAFDEASVKNIWLPKSLTSIGDDAFDDCIYLEEVHITDLSAWCRINFALGIGSTIRSYSNSNPLKYAKSLYLNGEKITDLVIPDDVEKINAEAFSYADFKSVYISDNVKEIGDYAFHACDKLATIHFGVNLMYLGNYTFSWCTTLTEIIFPESLQTAGEGAFQYCDNIERIYIGENFSHYHWRDSFGCKNLKEFIVSPKNNYFFAYDGALYCYTESYSEEAKKYVLDGGVELHHYPCGRKNASFTIPNFVTKLYEAFSHCYNLQSVTILEGITDAGCLTMLFNQSQVPNLEKVVVYAKTPPHTYYNGYGNIGSNVKLYVPAESMEEYKNAEGWNKFSIILPIDEGGAL